LPAEYDSGETNIAEFEYDALGRRIEMVAFDNSGTPTSTTTRYYYDDQRVLLETDATAAETDARYFVYGNYIDEVLHMHDVSLSRNYYYGHDHLYSPVVVFGVAGGLMQGERYEYDAYGDVKIMSGGYASRSASTIGNPYTFTGRRLDSLDPDGSGGYQLKLMYYRARTYDPQTGRFMQQDPLGINPAGRKQNPFKPTKQYIDGMNVFSYAINNSIINSDPYGLCTPVGEDHNGNQILQSCGDNEFEKGSCFVWDNKTKSKKPIACPSDIKKVCKVEVCCKPVYTYSMAHCVIRFSSNSDGSISGCRGGPGLDNTGKSGPSAHCKGCCGKWGTLVAGCGKGKSGSGDHLEKGLWDDLEHAKNNPSNCKVIDESPEACSIESCVKKEMEKISSKCYRYKPTGPNSNSAWYQALKNCGHDYNPPGAQPGSKEDLSKAETCLK
jgi:RHS repeat-associated protein